MRIPSNPLLPLLSTEVEAGVGLGVEVGVGDGFEIVEAGVAAGGLVVVGLGVEIAVEAGVVDVVVGKGVAGPNTIGAGVATVEVVSADAEGFGVDVDVGEGVTGDLATGGAALALVDAGVDVITGVGVVVFGVAAGVKPVFVAADVDAGDESPTTAALSFPTIVLLSTVLAVEDGLDVETAVESQSADFGEVVVDVDVDTVVLVFETDEVEVVFDELLDVTELTGVEDAFVAVDGADEVVVAFVDVTTEADVRAVFDAEVVVETDEEVEPLVSVLEVVVVEAEVVAEVELDVVTVLEVLVLAADGAFVEAATVPSDDAVSVLAAGVGEGVVLFAADTTMLVAFEAAVFNAVLLDPCFVIFLQGIVWFRAVDAVWQLYHRVVDVLTVRDERRCRGHDFPRTTKLRLALVTARGAFGCKLKVRVERPLLLLEAVVVREEVAFTTSEPTRAQISTVDQQPSDSLRLLVRLRQSLGQVRAWRVALGRQRLVSAAADGLLVHGWVSAGEPGDTIALSSRSGSDGVVRDGRGVARDEAGDERPALVAPPTHVSVRDRGVIVRGSNDHGISVRQVEASEVDGDVRRELVRDEVLTRGSGGDVDIERLRGAHDGDSVVGVLDPRRELKNRR
ncbi:hypothetical protein ON010_g36 [Phytophthora cinnamomi]|nr:hypothetical protein ON010_g36 [Phytophthora cinnamomi]